MIAALDAGTFYHDASLSDSIAAPVVAKRIWTRAFDEQALEGVTTLIVPCRTNPDELVRNADVFRRFLRRGGFLVAMGETRPDRWLDGVIFRPRATNWWWWLELGADLGLTANATDHAFWRHVHLADCAWHVHGVLEPPVGAVPLLHDADGGVLAYDDAATYAPGRAFVTTLDPFYHHGSEFMPATTRFLRGFLPWLGSEDAGFVASLHAPGTPVAP